MPAPPVQPAPTNTRYPSRYLPGFFQTALQVHSRKPSWYPPDILQVILQLSLQVTLQVPLQVPCKHPDHLFLRTEALPTAPFNFCHFELWTLLLFSPDSLSPGCHSRAICFTTSGSPCKCLLLEGDYFVYPGLLLCVSWPPGP